MILGWLDEAQRSGARLKAATRELGLDPRTVQRWRKSGGGEGQRRGPKTTARNKLSSKER